uniref:peptidylprolyl isomerase n=1 Tax=Mycena chlorophos TaxID=658473 RepID=A0ABQ0L239_MYCCL|nr:peptidyl-prolyl cis-trans isomerase [Mycena chlorophos]
MTYDGAQGVTVEILKPGDGSTYPKKGDIVTIHYVGTLDDGYKFDSSVDRQKPFQTEIGVGKVIKGWDEGVWKAGAPHSSDTRNVWRRQQD